MQSGNLYGSLGQLGDWTDDLKSWAGQGSKAASAAGDIANIFSGNKTPTSTDNKIFGLDPIMFYGLLAAGGIGLYLVLRRK
jgi:hypothetical protein